MDLLKKKIFQVIEHQLKLEDFESWLYEQNDLADRMSEEFILELYDFNYNQRGAFYLFKEKFLAYYDFNEFLEWKVIANLKDLSNGCENPERILQDFLELGYEEFFYLADLGYNVYQLDYCKLYGWERDKLLGAIQSDATELLFSIQDWMSSNKENRLIDFKSVYPRNYNLKSNDYNEVGTRKNESWWKFWK